MKRLDTLYNLSFFFKKTEEHVKMVSSKVCNENMRARRNQKRAANNVIAKGNKHIVKEQEKEERNTQPGELTKARKPFSAINTNGESIRAKNGKVNAINITENKKTSKVIKQKAI